MVERVAKFEASDGTLHDSMEEAEAAEFCAFFMKLVASGHGQDAMLSVGRLEARIKKHHNKIVGYFKHPHIARNQGTVRARRDPVEPSESGAGL